MKLSNKLYSLSHLGIVDWVNSGKDDENIRLIVNLLANHFFDEETCMDYTPGCDFYEIPEHFTESGYDVDWYELMSNEFVNTLDIVYAMDCIEGSGININHNELKMEITNWIHEWASRCRKVFIKKLEENNQQ